MTNRSNLNHSEQINRLLDTVKEMNPEALKDVEEFLEKLTLGNRLSRYIDFDEFPAEDTDEFTFLKLVADSKGIIIKKRLGKVGLSHYKSKQFLSKYGFQSMYGGSVYISPKNALDGVYIFQQQYSKAVISHETALYFHDLTDVIPKTTIMSLPKTYNLNQLFVWDGESPHLTVSKAPSTFHNKVRVIVHYSGNDSIHIARNNEIKASEIETFETTFGNQVRVTTPERTIADILKTSSYTEAEVMFDAVKRYMNNPQSKELRLFRIADEQGVKKRLDECLTLLRSRGEIK